jgi:hypothetical protein
METACGQDRAGPLVPCRERLLLDLAAGVDAVIPIVVLDTGKLFAQTHAIGGAV